ncbi:unnamed protein product [Cuscuta epithymum]|uniref:C3H1-type domain-containing protein n=1 Tax=Cuscuta epithymum TaxID=186058 RepID=A0AAV0GJ75_9ASTE|nr:unnamed protein product [Cuscuta epithymum]
MDESLKKRRSFWDSEENSSHHEVDVKNAWVGKGQYPSHDGRRFKEQNSSKADSSSNRYSSWNDSPQNSQLQPNKRISKDAERLSETEEHKRGKFYREYSSPTFDGPRQQRNSKFSEHGLKQSRRIPGRGRSRSRSWSREKRWRSRSRSRSRDKGHFRGRPRSHGSPPNQKCDSYEWDDRQIGSRMSSKVCREFSSGRCRRGGECRFFHPDNFKVKDKYSLEHNLAERWSGGHESAEVSRYANSETIEVRCRGKVPDLYNIESEHPRNNSVITCKDFGRGKCRWGASCRFSHSGSSSHIYDSSIRNTSPDYNWKHEPSKTSRRLCKYFVAGKCYSENCNFSHDGAIQTDVGISSSNNVGGHRLDNKKHNWDDLRWDDAEMDSSFNTAPIGESVAISNHSDAVHTDRVGHIGDHGLVNSNELWNKSVWDDDTARTSNLEKTNERLDTAARENSDITVPFGQTNSRWAHNSENERAMWKNTTSCEERDVYPKVESTLKSSSNDHYSNAISQASLLPSLGGCLVHGERQEKMKDASQGAFPCNVVHPYIMSNHPLESYPFRDTGKTNKSDVLNDVNIDSQTTYPVLLPEQRFNEVSERSNLGSEYSSCLDGAAQGDSKLHAIPSNGHSIIPKDSTCYQNKEAATRSEVLDLSLSGATFSVPTTEMHGSPAPLTEKFEYEPGKSQQHEVASPSVICSDSNPGLLPTFNAVYSRVDPVINDSDMCQAHGDESQWGMPDNFVIPVNASNLSQHGIKDSLKQMNQSSSLNSEAGHIKQYNASNVECTGDQCLKQQESGAKSELNENKRLQANDCGDEQQNNNPYSVGVTGKCEEVNGKKDDKVTRLFKIALIELVKEILKPKWKEGRMSREVHKTIVKKVVDKVMGSIQGDHFPKSQDKIEHYLSCSKAKINKLAQAYVERSLKENS